MKTASRLFRQDQHIAESRWGSSHANGLLRLFGLAFVCVGFERDIAVEFGIRGSVDRAHAAFADLGGDVIRAESGADGQGHQSVMAW